MKTEYHKIQTVFLRDPATKHKTLIEGVYAKEVFAYLADCLWSFTEKVDGTNIRLMWDGQKTSIGGRTGNAQIPAHLLSRLEEIACEMPSAFGNIPAIVYGEGFGAKIQKGGGNYISDGCDFAAFDVLINGSWLSRGMVEEFAVRLGCQHVPQIGSGTLRDAVEMCRAGFESRWGGFQAEGLIMRPEVEMLDRHGARIISKIKCKDFAE